MNYNVNVIRSNRKTVGLEVRKERAKDRIKDCGKEQGITVSELNALTMEAKQKIPVIVEKYAAVESVYCRSVILCLFVRYIFFREKSKTN